jgi:hypothetical protein
MALSVMKNADAPHDWDVTGGYDPALDGPDPQWGRWAIRCRVCEEERRISCELDDPRLAGGCRRPGPDTPWQPGDLLVRDGAYLDQFVCWLPGGLVKTFNRGGHYHETDPSFLRPC